MSTTTASAAFEALGTSAAVYVTDPAALEEAREMLGAELTAVDAACSRFRDDSELSRLNRAAGRPLKVGTLLLDAVDAALRAAALTDGDVDPTIGRSLRALGYDRDFKLLRERTAITVVAAAGWRRVALDRSASTVSLPRGVELDLGATGKAFAADRAAATIHAALGVGVLVNLGGDVATAGAPPAGGWRVRVTDDHLRPEPLCETVAIGSGALATSSVTARRWSADARSVHHIVDPRSGEPAHVVWRTVSVAAATCVDANTASTAAIVRGEAAPGWLDELALPSRLVSAEGRVVAVAGWPEAR